QREQKQQQQFRRKRITPFLDSGQQQEEVYFEANIFDLINAFTQALKEVPRELFYEVIKDEFTVEEKIHDILHLLMEKEVVVLTLLFKQAKNKLEIIATFLAVLELIRLQEIIVCKRELFEDIEIFRNVDNIVPHGRQ
ncbi:MAG: segregation/condensation protein A, partial [Candidatus Omnitrophica bacterium]|nr:segregation/condensation protein A [Candidatus Omnitrophota bacterium]